MAVRCVLGIVALLGLLVLAAWGAVQTETGRDGLARLIAWAASTPGEMEIEIGRIDGPLPQRLHLRDVTIRDGTGPWLTIDAATLEWQPWDLLRGRAQIDRIEAETLTVLRSPVMQPAPEPEPSGPMLPDLRLPIDVVVERLAIRRVALEQPVLGQAARFGVEGRLAAADPGGLALRLDVAGQEDQRGRAHAEIRFDPAGQGLDVAIGIEEPGGGLLAQRLDLPQAPALRFDLTGSGPLDAWSGKAVAQAGDETGLDATITVTKPGPLLIRVTGAARLAALLPEAVRPLVAPQLDLAFALAREADGTLVLQPSHVQSAALGISLQGSVDVERDRVDMQGEATLRDPAALGALAAPVQLGGAQARITATGRVARPAIALEATLREVAQASVTIGTARLAVDAAAAGPDLTPWAQVSVAATAALEGVALADPALAAALGDRVEARLKTTLDTVTSTLGGLEARIAAGDVALTATGTAGLAGPRVDAKVALAVPRLARFAPLAGMPLAGEAALEVTLRGDAAAAQAVLAGHLRGLDIGQPAAAALAGPEVTLRAEATRSADGTVRVSGLDLAGAGVTVTGDASMQPDQAIAARYRIAVPDLAKLGDALGQALGGRVELDGTAAGTVADPRIGATIAATDLRVQGQSIESVTAKIEASGLAAAPQGRVEIAARTPYGPVAASTQVTMPDPGRVRLSAIEVTARDTRIGGELTALIDSGLVEGRLQGRANALGAWRDLAGMALAGTADLQLEAKAANGRQGAEARVALRDLAVTPPGSDPLRAARIEARVEATDLLGRPAASLTATGERLTLGANGLRTLSVEASGTPENARFRVSGAGEVPKPFELALGGRVEQSGGTIAATLDQLTGRVQDRRIALRAPVTVRHGNGRTELGTLTLTIAGGTVTASGSLTPEAVTAELRIQDLPLSLLDLAAPEMQADGVLGGRLRVEGPVGRPRGEFRVEARRVKLSALAVSDRQRLRLDASGTFGDGRLSFDAKAGGPGGIELAGRGAVPLRLSLSPFVAVVPGNAAVSAEATMRGDLARVSDLLPPGYSVHRIAGRVDLSARVAGTVDAPQISGRVAVDRGEYEHLELGTLLRGLELEVAAQGTSIVVRRLAARDGGRGTLTGKGQIDLDPSRPWRAAVDLAFDNFVVLRREDITAVADARLSFAGSAEAAQLRGTITSDLVEARLIDRLPPDVVALDVVEVNGGRRRAAQQRRQPEGEAGGGADWLTLDIGVSLPQQVFVRGRGLDSEWAGQLAVKGSASAPVVTGSLRPVRGQFDLAGKTFRLAEGRIVFDGGTSIDPALNLSLRHQGREATAIVNVTGPASKPKIELASIPDMPRDEILARVLYDKGTGRLSPFEAAQLASALAQLSGRGGGVGLLDAMRGGLGLDVLRVGGGGASGNDPTIGAGKYIAKDVYVGVEQGAKPGTSAATVEIELTANVTVETGVGADSGGKVGVKWKWDY